MQFYIADLLHIGDIESHTLPSPTPDWQLADTAYAAA